ncbi:MAG: glycosyltransferase [Leptothrix sp. (in: Bacteria)]|nr:glycosyltransferase [Leptothrix sp. (in: b-proteobacteria)]
MPGPDVQPLLVLRRKRQTPSSRINELRAQGIPVETVTGLAHALTIWQLKRICDRFKPDVLVAHGFSEHLMGRYAGLLAQVPALVHIEHNSRERYTRWRLAQARWLAKRTAQIVGVSEGVKTRLLELGFPASKVIGIPNGIDLGRFQQSGEQAYGQRAANIVMCARFSAQKDHATAIRALALLKDAGHTPKLVFAGGGKHRYLNKTRQLAQTLGVAEQVVFMGLCSDVPALLMRNQIFLLSTRYEGMPLALIEGMAAGCAVIASDVIGVKEVIDHNRTGLLVKEQDPADLAQALLQVLMHPELGCALGQAAREAAVSRHGVELMRQRYEQLFTSLVKT